MRIIFHVHTSYSFDGYNSLDSIKKFLQRNPHVDFLSITDHDSIEAAIRLKSDSEVGHRIIIGEERTCDDGVHIIGLFLTNSIESTCPKTVVDEILSQGGLVYFPHPSRKDGAFHSEFASDILPRGHFLEVFNAKVGDDYNKSVDWQSYPDLLPVGGSDAHYNADLGRSCCVIPAYDVDPKIALRKSHVLRTIEILGDPREGDQISYFPLYYKYKSLLNLPEWLRETAKKIYPIYRNLKEKNLTPQLRTLHSFK